MYCVYIEVLRMYTLDPVSTLRVLAVVTKYMHVHARSFMYSEHEHAVLTPGNGHMTEFHMCTYACLSTVLVFLSPPPVCWYSSVFPLQGSSPLRISQQDLPTAPVLPNIQNMLIPHPLAQSTPPVPAFPSVPQQFRLPTCE